MAILSVILFHDRSMDLGPVSVFFQERGAWGVDLFFAISGILICSRLLAEEKATGSISLRSFYLRRLFRIFPAAWVFLLTYAALSYSGIFPTDTGGIVTSFLMVRNLWVQYAGDLPSTWYTIHFWSLSVEEHFYLLLPGLLVMCASRKRAVLLAGMSGACVVWMLTVMHFTQLQTTGVWLRTDFRLAELLIPACFAILLQRPPIRAFAARLIRPWVAIGSFVAIETLISRSGSHLLTTASVIVIPVFFPLIVISTSLHPAAWSTRMLELAPIRFVGRVSYSLYLWQQLFFLCGHTPAQWPGSCFQTFPWNYAAAFACATGSYYLIEKPLIRVGHRVASQTKPTNQQVVLASA